MARTTAAGILLTLLAGLACGRGEPDYLFVTVVDGSGGALAVPQDLDAFELRVASANGRTTDEDLVRFRRTVSLEDVATSLPQTLSITRAADGGSSVRVTVLGLRSGRVVQRIERVAAFGIGRVDLPEFALTPLCFGVVCPIGESCETDGVCRDGSAVLDGGPPVDAGPCGPLLVACSDECVPFSDDNCGSCGTACGASERCVSNRCVCDVGLVACEERCVDLGGSLEDCGECGAICDTPDATPVCAAGACRIAACDAGRADCDADPANGCETPLGTNANCSACGESCVYPNGFSECQPAGCVIGACNPGWDDCDGVRANGCETRLNTTNDCGACGNGCTVSRGTAGCSGGTCVIAACNGGRGDCNGSYSDGCETNLSSNNDCGSCGARCNPASASGTCGSGSCEIASCNAGRGDCSGGVSDGCETNLNNDESNCGACGVVCPTYERCTAGSCGCPNDGNYQDSRGPCLPSCGVLLNITSSPRGGTSCCMAGCTTSVVGGFRASWDCNYCCAAAVGVDACI